MALTFYNAYKNRYSYINIRSSNSVTSTKVGTLPDGNYYLYYDEIRVSQQSSKDYFIHLPAYGGWVACSSQGSNYISYGLSVYEGEAFAKYYWPDAGTTKYKLQKTASRTKPSFTLRSSPGNLTIDGTKSNITLTINYNNGTANGSQTGKKWTRTSYAFNGWDRKTSASAPSSVTAGTKDHAGGATYSSTSDLYFYADYATGTSSTQYSGNTKALGTPTKSGTSTTYTVTYNGNGGTVSTSSASATKTTTYTFNKWTGSNTNITVSGTSCTFTATGTVTASYKSSTSTTAVTLPTPTRTGYKFLGWAASSTATTGTYAGGSSYTPTASITLYAIWEINGLVRIYTGSEWSQKNKIQIAFELINQSSDEFNSPVFESEVLLEGIQAGKGVGYSKKESQQIAAHEAWNKLKKNSAFLESVLNAKSLHDEGSDVEKEVNELEAEQDTVPQLSVEVFRRTDEAERIISEAEEAAFKDM